MNIEFPKTLTAARALEVNQWALGDALLEECGPPGEDTSNNGSGEKLANASACLIANGLDYAEVTLRVFRDISHLYPHDRRLSSVTWWVHRAVPNPDMLDRLVESMAPGKTLTIKLAETMIGQIRQEQERQVKADTEAEIQAAKDEEAAAKERQRKAAEAARTAADEQARLKAEEARIKAAKEAAEAAGRKRQAEKKKQTLKPISKKDLIVPPAERLPGIALSSTLLSKAMEAVVLAQEVEKILDTRGDEISEVTLDAIIETALAAHQAWLKIARRNTTTDTTKRRLAAV